MANTAQAKKRARQSEKRRQLKSSQRAMLRTHLKKTYKAIAQKAAAPAVEIFKLAVPVMDSLARKGIIHPNKAARHKKRLNAHLKKLVGK